MPTTTQPMTDEDLKAIHDRWLGPAADGNFPEAQDDVRRLLAEVARLKQQAVAYA